MSEAFQEPTQQPRGFRSVWDDEDWCVYANETVIEMRNTEQEAIPNLKPAAKVIELTQKQERKDWG